jgi:membrane protease YdiL (CAAX protease family)
LRLAEQGGVGEFLDMTGRDTRFPWDFFALAYALSWLPWGVAYLIAPPSPPVAGTTEELLAAAPPAMLALVLVGVFGPFAAAFLLTWSREGRAGVLGLWRSGWRVRLPIRWLVVILLLFPVLRIVSLLLAGTGISLELFRTPVQLIGLAVFMYFLGGPFGEEFGWRGYALPRLLERSGALGASLVLAAFWIAWHLPLFFIPGSPQAQIPFGPWALSVVGLSVVFTWVHVHVGGAVFAAILLHTMANLSTDLFRPAVEAAPGWRSPDGIGTLLLTGVAVLIAIFAFRGRSVDG